MEFIMLLLVFAIGYCLYEIYEIKKELRKPTRAEEEKQNSLMYKKLQDLKDKQCEISFKSEMVTQSLKFNIQGVVEELDDDWVLLSGGNQKKEAGHLIRVNMIQDAKEMKR